MPSSISSCLVCVSHTPLMNHVEADAMATQCVAQGLSHLRRTVEHFSPSIVIIFGPDHFNGFFYDCMPQFCIGLQATAAGDFGYGTGDLSVDKRYARACVSSVVEQGIDAAVSFRMKVDHGFTQPLSLLTGAPDKLPVIPIFINCVAPPLPTVQRARLLGEAVGKFAKDHLKEERVLFLGSGGLSHSPPVPTIDQASPDVAERLIAGRNPSAIQRQEREMRVIAAAREFAQGTLKLQPLNPAWDQDFLERLSARNISLFDSYDNLSISAAGGGSAHEVKTWVAANAAMAAATDGCYEVGERFYVAISEWIAGFGGMEARSI